MKQANLERHWAEELARALAGAALPWRISSAWCTKDAYAAELTNVRTGACREIRLPFTPFESAIARRHEIVRQMQEHTR
jgi:hypothetical protein